MKQARILSLISLFLIVALVCPLTFGQKPKTRAAAKTESGSLVERVGATGFIQVEADSFRDLSPRQQALAYWLSRASIAIDPIIYDQFSRFGLRQKRILEAIVAHPQGIRPDVLKKITAYTKLKEHEWHEHHAHISAWERQATLDC